MIKLVVLGSGAAMPTKETIPSCFAVKYGDVFLFDAAEGVQRQLMLYGVSYAKIKAVFLTHLHADHFLGLLGLVQTMNLSGREDALKIYGPAGTTAFLSELFSFKGLKPKFPLVIKDARKGVVLRDKLYTVRAFETDHSCESLGYSFAENSYLRFHEDTARAAGVHGHLFTQLMEKKKLEINGKTVLLKDVTYKQEGRKIIFSGDTVPCASLARAAKGADLLIHDSCFAKDQCALAEEKKHSTAEHAAKIAKKAGVKQLMLTHISNRYNDRTPLLKEAQTVFPNTIIASEGMELMV